MSRCFHFGARRCRTLGASTSLAAAAVLALASGAAQAFEIGTGNPDLTIRWDNTVRANLAARVEGRDDKIGNSAIADEGTYSFDRGAARRASSCRRRSAT